MEHFLHISDIKICTQGELLKTIVGSCIALCIWDSKNKLGGMAHIMMPKRNGTPNAKIGKYADTAVKALVEMMLKNSSEKDKMKAYIIGGATMFPTQNSNNTIGYKNYLAVKNELKKLEIPIYKTEIGGTNGRKILFNCGTGEFKIYTLKSCKKI